MVGLSSDGRRLFDIFQNKLRSIYNSLFKKMIGIDHTEKFDSDNFCFNEKNKKDGKIF